MSDSRIGTGNRQDEPGTPCSSRNLESALRKEKTHNAKRMSKEYRNQLRELSMTKAKTIWAINIHEHADTNN